jgi:uncharacterized membrane protein
MKPQPVPKYLILARFIGWLSLAVGLSLLTPNDSIFYRVSDIALGTLVWAICYCGLGATLIVTSHLHFSTCSIIAMVLLALLWTASGILAAISGPLGTFAYAAPIVVIAIARTVWHETRAQDARD